MRCVPVHTLLFITYKCLKCTHKYTPYFILFILSLAIFARRRLPLAFGFPLLLLLASFSFLIKATLVLSAKLAKYLQLRFKL